MVKSLLYLLFLLAFSFAQEGEILIKTPLTKRPESFNVSIGMVSEGLCPSGEVRWTAYKIGYAPSVHTKSGGKRWRVNYDYTLQQTLPS